MADVLTGTPVVEKAVQHGGGGRRIQRILLALVIILAVALVAELVYHLAIAPRLAITTINLENTSEIPDQRILSVAGIQIGMMYFSVEPEELAARIEALPLVRDARVELLFPNRMRVVVTQREPLAYALAATDAGVRALVFDDEGVVFRVADTQSIADAGAAQLPVISGLRFPAAQEGLQLPELLTGFLSDLRVLQHESPALFNLFSEFRVVRTGDASFDVVLYPVHFNVPVRIGRTIDASMVEYVVMMLEMLRREGRLHEVSELDFRSGEGVLRAKGGDRG